MSGIIGIAAGGITGAVGSTISGGGDWWGVISYTGSSITGSSWGLLAGEIADGLLNLTEEWKKRFR